MIPTNTGEKIKNLREQHNMSQEDLAKIVHTSKQNIYKYEKGVITNIPLNRLESIAQALDTTPAYLMGWEDEIPAAAHISHPDGYDALSDAQKAQIEGLIKLFKEQNK